MLSRAVKNQMIEKKLILCGILAIAIGIATIIPLEYIMSAPVAQAALDQPWFNVNVPYVYCNLNESGGNNTMSWNGAVIQGLANFTCTPDAIALKGADAKIEYYQFAVSSDQGPIVNITYAIAYTVEKLGVTGLPGGVYMGITGLGDNTFTFANGVTYNGIPDYKGDCGGAGCIAEIIGDVPSGATNQTFTTVVFSDSIWGYNGNVSQVVTELRNAQTLSIDVSRICSVIYNGNVTVRTPASNQVLQHIELTKAGNGFVYGTYVQGTVPFPMETPTTPTTPAMTPAPQIIIIPSDNSTTPTP